MAMRWNTAKRNALAGAGANDLVVLDIYTGAQPASANSAPSGVLLGSITGIVWAQGPAGVQTVTGSVSDEDANATGTAGWGRFRNVADTLRLDGAVGVDFALTEVNIIAGGTIELTAATLTMPSGE